MIPRKVSYVAVTAACRLDSGTTAFPIYKDPFRDEDTWHVVLAMDSSLDHVLGAVCSGYDEEIWVIRHVMGSPVEVVVTVSWHHTHGGDGYRVWGIEGLSVQELPTLMGIDKDLDIEISRRLRCTSASTNSK